MKIEIETEKIKIQLTFTTGFTFCSILTWVELKKLIKKYPVAGYKRIKEAE